MLPRSLLAACALLAAATTAQSALLVEVYVPQAGTELLDFPQFDQMTPGLTREADVVSFVGAGGLFTWEVAGTPLSNDFALRITGRILVSTTGTHTFYLTSDDGSLLKIDGSQVVDNGDAHFSQERQGTVQLSQGWHAIEVQYFQRDLGASLSLEWSTPSTGRALIPAAAFAEASPPAPGLNVEVYVSATPWVGLTFPDYNALIPAAVGKVGSVAFPDLASFAALPGGLTLGNHFALRFVGSVKVEAAGLHTFYLTSDDGSLLFIAGALVVDNGGAHFSQERMGSVELAAGWHVLELHYFQADQGASLTMEWQAPGAARTVMAGDSLWDAVVEGAFPSTPAPVVPVPPTPAPATPSPAAPVTPVPSTPLPPAPGQALVAEVFLAAQGVELMDFPQFHRFTPDLVVGVEAVSFTAVELFAWEVAGVPLDADFAMRISGSVWVATPGAHTFFLTSDDGSLLVLDGEQVIYNGGAHFAQEREVTLQLAQGWHAIEVHYFQRDLGAELALEWTTPAMARALIPAGSYGAASESSLLVGQKFAQIGSVSTTFQFALVPVHMAVLPDGRVIGFGSSIDVPDQVGGDVSLYDPATGTFTYIPDLFEFNSFCSSVVYSTRDDLLAVVGGNTKINDADRAVTFYDHKTDSAAGSVSLTHPRWYGTLVVLHDGRIVVLGGSTGTPPGGFVMADEDVSEIPEIYDPDTKLWTTLDSAGSHGAFGLTGQAWWYPRGYAAPSSSPTDDLKVFGISGQQLWVLDVSGGGHTTVMPEQLHFYAGGSCASVMYTPGKLLVLGGGQPTNVDFADATSETAIVEYHSATATVSSRRAAPMQFARNWGTAVVLPNGEVAVIGGTRRDVSYADGDWVAEIEVWTPPAEGTDGVGSWRTTAKINKQRLYHSAAVLLPDATVLLGGGGVPPFDNSPRRVRRCVRGAGASGPCALPRRGAVHPVVPLQRRREPCHPPAADLYRPAACLRCLHRGGSRRRRPHGGKRLRRQPPCRDPQSQQRPDLHHRHLRADRHLPHNPDPGQDTPAPWCVLHLRRQRQGCVF